jgi:hypothetical protein
MASGRIRRPKPDRVGPRRNISGAFGSAQAGLIEDSVRNAYSVVEPWMKQGQRMARRLSRAAYGPLGTAKGARDLQTRWLQSTGEMVATWFDLLGEATDWILANGEIADDGIASSNIVFEITSHLPIRVHTTLAADPTNTRMKARQFKKRDGLRVRFRSRPDGLLVVRVKIRGDLGPGKYSSAIVDTYSGETVGRMRIVLG